MKTVAIIGGGPAGATAAETLLSRAGQSCARPERVVVFEEKRGWEKPCGGGLTDKALVRYPFLRAATAPGRLVRAMEIISPRGAVQFSLRNPLAIYSRSDLNHLLLRRAEEAGAEVIEDRIVAIERTHSGWVLAGRHERYAADYLILAAGARTRLRQDLVGSLSHRDFMLTLGYFVPGDEDLLRVELYDNFDGYAWSFPRRDHLSVGICGKAGRCTMAELREKLAVFMKNFHYSTERSQIFSHLIPSLSVESWAILHLAGESWAIVGDAAGLADPLTGEGIYFAMRSGEEHAEALLEGMPGDYPARVWREFGSKLALGARLCDLFYQGDFLGWPITTCVTKFAARSSTFMELLQDLIEGKQSYPGLARRLYWGLASSLSEMAINTVKSGWLNI